ncbi:MAG: hypothetical protein LBF67_00930 [Prevotellaceae bacterium]|nr:hypothetical protein [Prevotellaceae bacterium]
MQTKEHVNNHQIADYDDVLDSKYGKVGTPEREAFRQEAYAYCMGQVIFDARKVDIVKPVYFCKKTFFIYTRLES